MKRMESVHGLSFHGFSPAPDIVQPFSINMSIITVLIWISVCAVKVCLPLSLGSQVALSLVEVARSPPALRPRRHTAGGQGEGGVPGSEALRLGKRNC